MNIFINNPSVTIGDFEDGNTYYFDNRLYSINVTLSETLKKIRITLCLLYSSGYNVTVQTSKGIYILDKDLLEMSMIHDEYWYGIGGKNLLPMIDSYHKQEIPINLYNYSRSGENLILTYDRGGLTGDNERYKMSNLVIIGVCNYHSKKSSYDGEGAVWVYKRSGDNYYSEHIITEGYDSKNGSFQGEFGKNVKLVDMGGYDLLVVSAPFKVQDNKTFRTVLDDVFGYIYVYSYRKNNSNGFYFHRETKIPLPSIYITKDMSKEVVDEYLPSGTIFQMEPLKNIGIVVSYKSKNIYLYDLRNTNNVIQQLNQTLLANFIKISENDIYLSYNTEIKKISNASDLSSNPVTIITNSYNVEFFGRIIYPYDQGIVVISEEDFFDFDLSYQLKKRISFPSGILSFDLFSDQNIRKYYILIDAENKNLYVLDNEYKIIANGMYKEDEDDIARLVRSDASGETVFISSPNHDDLDNNIVDVGLVTNYDVFFERNRKLLNSLFPDFNIFNQVLVEEKTLLNQKYFYLEEKFMNEISLISNRNNNKKTVEYIYPVSDDNGIVFELNYDVSYNSFLSRYSKYFIYSNPIHSDKEYSYILNANNRYLGWSDNDTLTYNNPSEYATYYVYKSQDKIKLVLLSIGILGSGKRWNIIESEMVQDPSKNIYDISMTLFGPLNMLQFVEFEKFVHNNEVIFIVKNRSSITIIDYFNRSVITKNFNRDITYDMFYIDSFKNLFHLFSVVSENLETFYLSIYKHGDYESIILDNIKTDIKTHPYQIVAQYYDGAFVFLENYGDTDGNIVVRKFDIIQQLAEKIQFEEVNISNEFEVDKHIIDVEFYRDSISKLVLVNTSEKDDKIFNKKSQKIYTLPRILSTKYQNFQKNNVRQLMVKEKNYVNYEQYKIEDEIPNVFYNIAFQKYFKNNIGIYSNYEFFDNKDKTKY
jgi:hypothetical protein